MEAVLSSSGHKMSWRNFLLRLLWMMIISSVSLTASASAASHSVAKRQASNGVGDKRVVCYFANWAVYRQGTAKFVPQNINPYLCTHLIYAFGGLSKDDTIQPFDKYQDIEKGGYSQFAALKTYNKELKTLLAMGGWNEGSKRFSPLVEDPKRRRTFIKSAVRFLRQYNFDGLDLDWEYPTQRDGGRPQDRENYAKFVAELREAFELESEKTGKPRLLLTMAVPASLEYTAKGFDVRSLNRHLDFFNLLTYDYHSSYEAAVNHHSPLFRPKAWSEFDHRAELNIDSTIQFYLAQGASRDKLVLGIPSYGRSYSLINPSAHETGSPTSGPGEQGKGTKEDGYLAYYEVCEAVKDKNWQVVHQFPGAIGPYAYKGDQWVGYDDIDAVQDKAIYVSEEGLGGIMFWTIDNDDFRGYCHDRPFPLIEAAKEALYGKVNAQVMTSVSVSTSEDSRVERLRLTADELAELANREPSDSRSSGPRTVVVTPAPPPSGVTFDPFNTPEPPTTPSSEPQFECQAEGFFPHKGNCKKYFWCLEAAGLGMVAHTFTCPTGLYFNTLTDGCDFLRNVDCGSRAVKADADSGKAKATTEKAVFEEDEDDDEDDEEDPRSLKDILSAIKNAGGLEAFEENLKKEEEEKENRVAAEEERRVQISTKTRSRLNRLIERKKSEANKALEGGANNNRVTSPAPPTSSSTTRRSGLLSRLASRRLNTSNALRNRLQRNRDQDHPASTTTPTTTTPSPTTEAPSATSARSRLFRNRSRFSIGGRKNGIRNGDADDATTTTEAPRSSPSRGILRNRDRFQNLLNRNRGGTRTSQSAQVEEKPEEVEPAEEEEEEAPRPRFKPKAGVRDRVRATLHLALQEEEQRKEAEEEEESSDGPANTQRVPPTFGDEDSAERPRVLETSERPNYVVLNRGNKPPASSQPDEDQTTVAAPAEESRQRGNLEYVTLSRGVVRSEEESAEAFVTPLPAEEEEEDDDVTSLSLSELLASLSLSSSEEEEAPAEEGRRELEYVTIQRGEGDSTRSSEQVGVSSPRARAQHPLLRSPIRIPFPPARRSKRDVAFIYPTDLNPRERLAQQEEASISSALPAQDSGVAYVFPFSPEVRRDQRQVSPEDNEVSLDGSIEEKEESTTTTTTTTTTTSTTTTAAPEPLTEAADDYSDYEVSVSVSKSVSESFSVSKAFSDFVELVTSTMSPMLDEEEETEEPETTTATTTSTTTEQAEPSQTPKKSLSSLFASSKRKSPGVGRIHPILAAKKASEQEATTERLHPFFKQRTTSQETTTTTTTIELEDATEPMAPEEEDDLLELTTTPQPAAAETSAADDTTTSTTTEKEDEVPETTTKLSLLQKIKERQKAQQQQQQKVSSGLLSNRNNRPKFQIPLRKATTPPKTTESNAVVEEKEATTARTASTRSASRFRPLLSKNKRLPATQSPLLTTRRRTSPSRATISGSSSSTTPSSPTTANALTRLRNRVRSRVPADLAPAPSRKVISSGGGGESTTTTAAPALTTTAKLTVAELLANLNGDKDEQDAAVTLRPKSFKPKFGNKQRDKLRKRLREQLEHEEDTDEDALDDEQASEAGDGDEVQDEAAEEAPAVQESSSGRSRVPSRTRSRFSSASQPQEKPRTSQAAPSLRRSSLRTRTRPSAPAAAPAPPIGSSRPRVRPSAGKAGQQRLLSDSDIMAGLGLKKKQQAEQTVTESPAPAAQSGESLLLMLVQANQQKEAEDSSLEEDLTTLQPLEEPEQQKPLVLALNPQDLLKSAVVESNIPAQVTAKPFLPLAAPVAAAPAEEDEVIRPPFSPRRLPSSARTRSRTRSRFSPVAVPSSTSSPAPAIDARRQRISQRGRTSPTVPASTTTSTTTAAPRASSSRSRGRLPSSRRRLISRQRLATIQKQPPIIEVEEEESNSIEQPPAPVSSRFSSRRSQLRSRQRIAVARPAAPEEEAEEEAQAVKEEEPTATTAAAARSVLSRSRSRFNVGKSDSEEEASTESSAVEQEQQAADLATATEKARSKKKLLPSRPRSRFSPLGKSDEEEEEEAGSFRPTTFRSVSPGLGVTALPISFFQPTLRPSVRVERSTLASALLPTTTPGDFQRLGVSGHAFLLGEEVTTAATPQAEEEASTIQDEEDSEDSTVRANDDDEASDVQDDNDDEDSTVQDDDDDTEQTTVASEKKARGKVSIRKGLFGRKRPSFLKKLEKKKQQQKKEDQPSFKLSKPPKAAVKSAAEQQPKQNKSSSSFSPLPSVKRPRRKLDLKSLLLSKKKLKKQPEKSSGSGAGGGFAPTPVATPTTTVSPTLSESTSTATGEVSLVRSSASAAAAAASAAASASGESSTSPSPRPASPATPPPPAPPSPSSSSSPAAAAGLPGPFRLTPRPPKSELKFSGSVLADRSLSEAEKKALLRARLRKKKGRYGSKTLDEPLEPAPSQKSHSHSNALKQPRPRSSSSSSSSSSSQPRPSPPNSLHHPASSAAKPQSKDDTDSQQQQPLRRPLLPSSVVSAVPSRFAGEPASPSLPSRRPAPTTPSSSPQRADPPPLRASSLLILSQPQDDPLPPTTTTPAPRETPRRLELFIPALLEAEEEEEVKPPPPIRVITPGPRRRPEEALFHSVQDGASSNPQDQLRDRPRSAGLSGVTRAPSSALSRPRQRARRPTPTPRPTPRTTTLPPEEYEYYYEYYYDEDDYDYSSGKGHDEYDLIPLSNKVEILANGKPQCYDVGVFPHPDSCRKFVMCSRRATGKGISGWEYECPSYLAFDPVGGRCNWATEVVCAK